MQRRWWFGRCRLIWNETFSFWRENGSYCAAFNPWHLHREEAANDWHPRLYVEWAIGPFVITRFETEKIADGHRLPIERRRTPITGIALALLAAMLAIPLLLAADDEKPWPQKGDTVYVSAALSGIPPITVIGGGNGGVPSFDACIPATFEDRDDEKPQYVIRTDTYPPKRRLLGPWLPRFHRTEVECRAALKELGQPHVEFRAGWKLIADHQAPSN